MPNGNINSDALDSLIDPKGNIVLEEFNDSAYETVAVLLRPESAAYRAQTGLGDPYVVAYGYDKKTGEWSHGYYTSNLSYSDAVLYGNLELERNPELAIDGKLACREDFKGLDSSKEPKEYGIDQLMADLSDEAPEIGEDGPGGRD